MFSKDATIKNGMVKRKVTDTIYKGFMLYKAGTNEFEARSNSDGTVYKGSLDDVKNKIDKYWERKDAEEVLKNKDSYLSPGAGLEERKQQKEILKAKYPDYNPVRHDVFVSRYNKEEQLAAEKQYRVNRGIEKDSAVENIIGKHNDIPDDQFDPEQLQLGIETEMEHTDSDEVAKSIAKDHLSEYQFYYSYLQLAEQIMEKNIALDQIQLFIKNY